MTQKRKTPSLGWLLLSLVLTTVATIPVAYVVVPYAKRWQLLGKLTDPNLTQRERGLNYVIQFAGEDPHVLRAAIRCLGVQDRANFLQLVHALDQAGQWKRPIVPLPPWLRWLEILGSDPSAEARILAIQLLAQQQDLADHPRTEQLIQRWLDDPDPDVRYNALVAAAGLCAEATARTPYEALITHASTDAQPTIARHAWLILGLINPTSGVVANWRNQPPPVAKAMLWATLNTNPQHPEPAIQALQDPTVDPATRAMAAYALHLSNTPEAKHALTEQIRRVSVSRLDSPDEQRILWRAILAVRLSPDTPDAPDAPDAPDDSASKAIVQLIKDIRKRQLISTMKQLADMENPREHALAAQSLQPLLLSAYYRLGAIDHDDLRQGLEHQMSAMLDQPLIPLATLEGLPIGRDRVQIPASMPDILRLSAVAVTANPKPEDLQPLFASPRATLRDLACVVAADRFSDSQNERLVASLLNNFNDDAKCSGAILAGLTGLQPELLAKKARHEDVWSVRQIMSLGLWMQGHPPPEISPDIPPDISHTGHGSKGRAVVEGLLTRDDLPTTTVLLAMLHMKHTAAWDFLFNPQGEEQIDLLELFDQARWWRVLKRYLPPDAPPFWVWADPQLAQFQIDLLREWYLLHRPHWPPR